MQEDDGSETNFPIVPLPTPAQYYLDQVRACIKHAGVEADPERRRAWLELAEGWLRLVEHQIQDWVDLAP